MLLISQCTREEAVHENHPETNGLNVALDNDLGVFVLGSETQANNNLTYFYPGELPHFRQLTIILQYFFFFPLRLEAHLDSFFTLMSLCHRQLIHTDCYSVDLFIQCTFYSAHKWLTAQTAKPTSADSCVHTARKLRA